MIEASQILMPTIIAMSIAVAVIMLYQNWKEEKPLMDILPAIILTFIVACGIGFIITGIFESQEKEGKLMTEFCENPKAEGTGFSGYRYYCIFENGTAREFTCNVKGCGWLNDLLE